MKTIFVKISYGASLFIVIWAAVTGIFANETDLFRLSGKHKFQNKRAEKWSVTRILINQETAQKIVYPNFLEAKGDSAQFELEKSIGNETIFQIRAEGKNFLQDYRVRVFAPDEISSFLFETKANILIKTFVVVPKTLSPQTRVLLLMHGMSRTSYNYIRSWDEWAEKNDYIVVAPKFDIGNWNGSRRYNLGNMFKRNGEITHKENWTFQIVEDLFHYLKISVGFSRDTFDIFGHSAGGQFVHRFLMFKPDAKVRIAFAANPGWYTIPDLAQDYPYGLRHPKLSFSKKDIFRLSEKHVVLLRGALDTERTANLRQSPEADAQGQNRYERAGYMFEFVKKINPKTNWRLIDIPDVAHDQSGMAPAAQKYLDEINSRKMN